MKNKKSHKLIWALFPVGVVGGGILLFNSDKTDPLEPEGEDSSVVVEKVEGSEISRNSEIIAIIEKFKGSDNAQNSEIDALIEQLKTTEITQDPEFKAKLELIKGFHDLTKHLKDLEKNGLPPGAVKVIDSTSYRPPPPWVQYINDERAAELGLSHYQVAEFQKIVNYYRQRLNQHIMDNSTVEVLGDGHHKINIPKIEGSSEIRDSVNQELRLLLGDQKYDEFSKSDEGRLDKYFDLYGEYPRTVEMQATGKRDSYYGGEYIDFKKTIHYNFWSSWSGGKFSSKRKSKEFEFYTDLIASHN